jgi:thiamine transport system permease protein
MKLNKSKSIAFALLIWLFIPDLVLIIAFGSGDFPDWKDFSWILKNTLLQALGSSIAAIVLGIVSGLGLLAFDIKKSFLGLNRKKLNLIFLVPNIFPTLFVILSTLSVFPRLEYGTFATILIHTVVNTGLIGVLFAGHVESKLGSLIELAWLEGASFWNFFKVGILQMLRKEIFFLWGFVFTISFMSFSVPLIVGGSHGTTFEVAIYEQIVINGNLAAAVNLSLAQAVFLIAFGFLPGEKKIPLSTSHKNFSLLAKKWMIIPGLFCSLLIFISPLISFSNGLQQLRSVNLQFEKIWPLLIGSFQVGLLSGLLIFGMGMAVCFAYNEIWMRKLLKGFNTPSIALIGLIYYLMPKWINISAPLNVAIGLSILFFPMLYRLLLETRIESLFSNIQTAVQIGANSEMISKSIVLPQMAMVIGLTSGLASLWAVGDFALSSMASSNEFTLGLLIKALMGHYRIDAAQVLSLPLLLIGLVCFSIFAGVGRVLSRKSFL